MHNAATNRKFVLLMAKRLLVKSITTLLTSLSDSSNFVPKYSR